MKDAIRNIVGKRVAGVVVKEASRPPRTQVFLVFSDGTFYELYGDIAGAGGVDRGGIDAVRSYLQSDDRRIVLDAFAPDLMEQ